MSLGYKTNLLIYGWINKNWYSHTVEYDFAIGKEWSIDIPATTWMKFENIMLSEKSQAQKVIYYKIPLIWHNQKR